MSLGLGLGLTRGFIATASGGVAPSNSVAPVASVPYAIAGQTLSCTTGTWSGTPTITYTYQWQSSADGSTGWANVGGATSSTYVIPSSAAQLLFYRCVVTASNGIGSPVSANSNVVGGVDSQANTHFNRVTADSGVMTYGLAGVDTYTKTLKYIYNVSDITTKFAYVRHLDYLGYKAGSGTGVTAGRAIQTIYSLTGVNYDLRQTTLASQPALAAWTGTNYMACFSTDASGISTPNNVNNQLINDFSIEARVEASTNDTALVSKNVNGSTNGNFSFYRETNRLKLRLYQGSTSVVYQSTTTSSLAYVRVSRNATTGIIKFFHSSNGTSWTQVGTDVAGITGTLDISASANLWVGFSSFIVFGNTNYYYANVYKDDSFTTITQSFDASRFNRAVSATTITAATGEVWTIANGAGATGLKSIMSDQTMIQGNGTSMGMHAASATLNTLQFTQYNAWRKFSNAITSTGVLNEFGNVATGQGLAFAPNEVINTESVYTRSNAGLNGTSWVSNSLLLKVSTFRGNIANTREQSLATNNSNNTLNADQATNNNTDAIVATGDNLLARNNAASLWVNNIYVANLLSVSTDSGAEETAVYNYLAPLIKIV